MFIPLKDENPTRITPFINYALIIANAIVFLYEVTLPNRAQASLAMVYGTVPVRIAHLLSGHGPVDAALFPLFTSMFLHAGFVHLLGNMLFLWIFGDNIEDYLGHFRYLLFYLGSGIIAALSQIILNPNSAIPTVGASGAIAGVMGGYFILYPRARVLIWFPPIFFFHVPAWLMLGYWFLVQFFSGTANSIAVTSQTTGGIAFWAHVGGFVAGVLMIKIFSERPQRHRYGAW